MSVAIEDAGLSVIDSLAWVHGQGYAAGFRSLDEQLRQRGENALAEEFAGFGNVLRPAFEPIVAARNLPEGTLVDAIIGGGAGGFNIDATRIPAGDEDRSRTPGRVSENATWRVKRESGERSTPPAAGRMPGNVLLQHTEHCTDNECHDFCPVRIVREQGSSSRGRGEDAARFYPVLHHPKASRGERPSLEGVGAPVVKPLGVMEWLVALATRPGQLVLDPFAGTGTTLEACARAGVRAVGIERHPEYLKLAEIRLHRLTTPEH
jgi:site-specific DNA-methyltransferase (adenine-specific)